MPSSEESKIESRAAKLYKNAIQNVFNFFLLQNVAKDVFERVAKGRLPWVWQPLRYVIDTPHKS